MPEVVTLFLGHAVNTQLSIINHRPRLDTGCWALDDDSEERKDLETEPCVMPQVFPFLSVVWVKFLPQAKIGNTAYNVFQGL